MNNSSNASVVFALSALDLVLIAISSAFGLIGGLAAISIAMTQTLLFLLILLDFALLYFLFSQETANEIVLFSILVFVSIGGLCAALWFLPMSAILLALCVGYAILLLFGILVVSNSSSLSQSVRPEPSVVVFSPPAQNHSSERLEQKVDEARREERENKEELKEEFQHAVTQVRREEQNTKETLALEIARVKQDVRKAIAERKAPQVIIKRIPARIRKAKKEPDFFIASKTGKSMHKENCIVLANIPRKKRIIFNNEKLAVKQGYHLCRVCFPTGNKK